MKIHVLLSRNISLIMVSKAALLAFALYAYSAGLPVMAEFSNSFLAVNHSC